MKYISIFIVLFFVFACHKQESTKTCSTNPLEELTFLKEIVEQNQNETYKKVEIYEAVYKNQPAYLVYECVGCADASSYLYDCKGTILCEFGGFTGLSTCPDYEKEGKKVKLIWSNQ